ncbi:MAG: chorismate synthase, partial [Desulfobacterales bacterium]|nr:chorismate synthase [Desulfobacterales bacterium]
MPGNAFGSFFRITTWGESHGPALGVVIDGCPPGIVLNESIIQPMMDRRKPGSSAASTSRREPDCIRILSGVFEGRSTGTPISILIENADAQSVAY